MERAEIGEEGKRFRTDAGRVHDMTLPYTNTVWLAHDMVTRSSGVRKFSPGYSRGGSYAATPDTTAARVEYHTGTDLSIVVLGPPSAFHDAIADGAFVFDDHLSLFCW